MPEVTGSHNSKQAVQPRGCVITEHRASDSAQTKHFSSTATFTVITTEILETFTNNLAGKKWCVVFDRLTYLGCLTTHCQRHTDH
jgi:hypothetical protein